MDILNEVYQELKELSKNPKNIKDYSRFYKDNKKHIGLAAPIVKNFPLKNSRKLNT